MCAKPLRIWRPWLRDPPVAMRWAGRVSGLSKSAAATANESPGRSIGSVAAEFLERDVDAGVVELLQSPLDPGPLDKARDVAELDACPLEQLPVGALGTGEDGARHHVQEARLPL